ncbi:heavy metal-associated isoprenylated plant protein 33-like [Oryza brachyantha]|uniref:HMA domain-containing protein n=1 Tax=Oryza brachyantha TaxID=4533 RepID=J3L7J2_ORYBR|nr:heavy metal-associated isoprenylated plant protein 33-like [Oryza brachyantha]
MASGSEPIECQALVLKVSIHCEGCKKKVKKVLQSVPGVFRCDIDGRSNKVTVTASRNIDANILVAKLRKSNKQAEPWPEEPKQQQQQQPAESQSQETKNQNDESSKASDQPAEKPGPDSAEGGGAEPGNPQPSPEPKKSADETPKPAQEVQETSSGNGDESDEAKAAETAQQPSDPKGKAKQHQEQRPIDARVTMEYGGGGRYVNHTPQPVHVMSYSVARPTASAAYYTAPPAPVAPTPAPAMATPMPMARPSPSSQGYIDEEYSPSYYNRPSPYEPYNYPQPSPYRYQHYQQSSADDYYYYGAPQQRSAFSPPRDAYGEMFNDENANSCSVM